MEWSRNLTLEKELFDRLRNKYTHKREGIHLSDLLGCLTKTWYDKHDPIIPTDTEMGFFAIGFALEQVLLRNGNPDPEPKVFLDITMSTDYVSSSDGNYLDLKTTRKWIGEDGAPRPVKGESIGWPTSWLRQFKFYALEQYISMHKAEYDGCDDDCWCRAPSGTQEIPNKPFQDHSYQDFHVAIMYLGMPPNLGLVVGTLRFTPEELWQNATWVLDRRDTYKQFDTSKEAKLYSSNKLAPEPYKYNEDWECKNCRYSTRCQLRASLNAK